MITGEHQQTERVRPRTILPNPLCIGPATSNCSRTTRLIMSDFELSDTPMHKLPSADAMEAALRREVVQQFDDDGKTVNTVREGAERSLGLKRGFFKENKIWKEKSKGIIKDEIVS